MTMYRCQKCNIITKDKYNFKRHLNTEKHLKNTDKMLKIQEHLDKINACVDKINIILRS